MKYFILIIFNLIFSTNLIANCDFKSANYIKELKDPSNILEIKIKIPNSKKYNKNFLKIILSDKLNIDPSFKKSFFANIEVKYPFGYCKFKGKVRQTGDWKDHITMQDGQPVRSLIIKLDEGNILSSIRFKLLIPSTRNNLNEVLGTVLLRNIGYMTPETFQVMTDINGVRKIMLFQEDIRKEFLEKNKKHEGPIFEGDESLLWSFKNFENFELEALGLSRLTNRNWFLAGMNSEIITLKAYKQLQLTYLHYSQNQDLYKKHFLAPNDKSDYFTQYYLSLIAHTGLHAARPHNRKFYYNRFSREFEPIYYDGMFKLRFKELKDKDYIQPAIINNPLFIYKPNYLDIKNEKELLLNFKKRSLENDQYNLNFFNESLKRIKANEIEIIAFIENQKKQETFEKNINKDFKSYINSKDFLDIDQNVLVKILYEEGTYNGYTHTNNKINLLKSEISDIISRNKYKENRYVYIPILDKSFYSYEKDFISTDLPIGRLTYSKGLNISFDKEYKYIYIKQSNPDDWILFKGANLKNTKIIFSGLKNNKISKKSQRFNAYGLTGCLSFYDTSFSNVSIDIQKGMCEDSLNIIRSEGTISHLKIEDAYSDGVDMDFSNINIKKVNVNKANNDCIDLSGGKYNINKITVNDCGDKGVSIGEKSIVEFKKVEIDNSIIGLSTKDLSVAFIEDAIFKNAKICLEAKKKKQEFGGAKISAKKIFCETRNSIDKDSIIIMDKY